MRINTTKKLTDKLPFYYVGREKRGVVNSCVKGELSCTKCIFSKNCLVKTIEELLTPPAKLIQWAKNLIPKKEVI